MAKTIETGLENNPIRLLGEAIMGYAEREITIPLGSTTKEGRNNSNGEGLGSAYCNAVLNAMTSLYPFRLS